MIEHGAAEEADSSSRSQRRPEPKMEMRVIMHPTPGTRMRYPGEAEQEGTGWGVPQHGRGGWETEGVAGL